MKKRIILIVLFGILNILLVGVTYSFFTSESSLFANQDIAKFIFDAKEMNTISVPITDLNPGDSTSVEFLVANNVDANLIHEAAIGKIAGEQLTKLMTLGLSEEEAEEKIVNGFLK